MLRARMRAAAALALAALSIAPPRSAAEPLTFVELHSAPGDFIGQGRDYYTAPGLGDFIVRTVARPADGPVNVIRFTVSGQAPLFPALYADLFFSTHTIAGNYLEPGTYEARRYPFQPTGFG